MNEHDDAFRMKVADRQVSATDARYGVGTAPAAPVAPAPAPAAPDPAAAAAAMPAAAPVAAPTGGGDRYATPAPEPPPAPPATGVAAGSPSLTPQPQTSPTRSFGDALKAVAKDVGWGAVEAIPQYMIGGRIDFYKHLLGSMTDLGQGLEKVLPSWLTEPGGTEKQMEDAKALREKYGEPFMTQMFGDLIGDPSTVTGGMARNLGTFMQGYRLPFGMLKEAGAGGMVAAPIAGAISGFLGQAPDEKGFANLLEKLPGPVGTAFSALATNPDDPAILNRARHAAEQAGLGVVAEGLTKGVQMFAAHRRAAAEAAALTPEAQAAAAAETQQATSLVQAAAPKVEAQAPLFTMTEAPSKEALAANKLQDVKVAMEPGVPNTVLANAVAKGQTLPELRLNYQNFTKENLPDVAQQIGNSIKDRLSDAKRGVITNDMTRSLANKLGMTPDDLLAKPLGEAWNAEKIYGSAALIGQADKDLKELAAKAATPGSSLADGFAFRRQLTYYAAMMENFTGAAGEAGRALQIFQNIHQSGVLRQAKAIQAVIEKGGGLDNTRALAEVIANADQMSLSTMAKQGWKATTAEAIRTSEVMNMMFRPATQIRNIVGNLGMMGMASSDIKNAANVGWLVGTPPEEAITKAGVGAYNAGQFYGLRNALSQAGKAFSDMSKPVESQFEKILPGGGATAANEAVGSGVGNLSASQRFAVERGMSDEAIKQFTESGFGKAMDYMASAVTIPGRFLTAADDFFKFAVYSGRVHQMATDEAVRLGLSGQAFENHVASAVLNPPEHINIDASDWAMWATFNNKVGPINQAMMDAREATAPFSYLVFPFMRTPGNIMNVTLEHSPFAPLMARVRADIMAGGVDRDLALGKMATGATMLTTMMALAESGHLIPTDPIDPKVSELLGKHITGSLPNKPELADAYTGLGVQRYALRMGDKWVAVSGLGQLAAPMAFAAEVADIWRRQDIRPDEYSRWGELAGLATGAIYGSMKDQSYFQGFAQLMNGLDEAARGNEGAFERWLYNTTGSGLVGSIPFAGGMMTSTQKLWEPQTPSRETFSLWDAIQKHVWGLSENVPPVRDRLGDIMPPPTWSGDKFGRAYDWFMPFPITKFTPNPLREELVRLQSGLQRLNKVESFDKVPHVDFRNHPEAFDMFVRLAGNEAKDPAFGLGFKDYMSAVIKGDDPRLAGQHQLYNSLSDSFGETLPGTKMAYIKAEASRFKDLAGEKLMQMAPTEYPEFYKQVTAEKQRTQAFETGRAGIVPPMEDWSYKFSTTPTLEKEYTRAPSREKQNGSGGGGGFTVPGR